MLESILQHYQTQNILGFVALLLAYLVYRKSIVDEYKSWLDLANTFMDELEYMKAWIGREYNTPHPDGRNPTKLVYPITSEAGKAMIWKGHPPTGLFPPDFFRNLTIFNERVLAFNQIIEMQALNYVVNRKGVKAENEAQYINEVLHNRLIGAKHSVWGLNNLYNYFVESLETVVKKELDGLVWYLRKPRVITITCSLIYLVIDYFFI